MIPVNRYRYCISDWQMDFHPQIPGDCFVQPGCKGPEKLTGSGLRLFHDLQSGRGTDAVGTGIKQLLQLLH